MTKTAYDRAKLDELGYRLFDLACSLRSMARSLHDASLEGFQLHDRKAMVWLGDLEDWVEDAQVRLRRDCNRARGTRRARRFQDRDRNPASENAAPPSDDSTVSDGQ